MLLALFANAALADCSPLAADTMAAQVEQARDALKSEDEPTFMATRDRLLAEVPCLVEPVDPRVWARFLVALSVASSSHPGEDWQSPLISALAADPTVDRLARSPSPVATFVPPSIASTSAGYPPDGVTVYVDGVRVPLLPLRGPHLIQARTADGLRSAYAGDLSKADWEALLKAEGAGATVTGEGGARDDGRSRHGGAWIVTGGVVGALGAGLGAGTWIYARSYQPSVAGDTVPAVLNVLNTAGWSLGLVGLGLGTTGVILLDGASVTLGPRRIGLRGEF